MQRGVRAVHVGLGGAPDGAPEVVEQHDVLDRGGSPARSCRPRQLVDGGVEHAGERGRRGHDVAGAAPIGRVAASSAWVSRSCRQVSRRHSHSYDAGSPAATAVTAAFAWASPPAIPSPVSAST